MTDLFQTSASQSSNGAPHAHAEINTSSKLNTAQYLTVGDVVHRSERENTDNDVQLDLYSEEKGRLEAARSYIFTAQGVGNTHSPVAIFEKVRGSLLSSSDPNRNRHVVVATYGHGKSHLAVAMASFFGGAADAPEVGTLLEGIKAVSPAEAANFKAFKAAKGACLVLRLNGSHTATLTEQVVKGMENALREHEATRDANLGFWFDPAVRVLDNLTDAETVKANAFLGSRQMDVAGLRARVADRDASLYELCAQTIGAAKGIRPDFGGTIELKNLIHHVADQWCGGGKPFGGLLVLFDEFNAFVKKYAESPAFATGSPLQSLLDGVKNREGKVAFVAFSQYEPEATARLILNRVNASDGEVDDLIKELNRLPQEQHYQLYSSIELVLESYLHQDDAAWENLNSNDRVADAIADSYNIVLHLFAERYSAQKWDDETVYRVLARGCFPLHPLTTAILCSAQLREVTDPRGVLGFVKARLEEKRSQFVVRDGVPNWIYAESLVDWFGEALTEDADEWRQYTNALRTSRADVDDAPPSHALVLRAMMLHATAKLKVGRGGDDFEKNIAALSGLTKSAVKSALQQLVSGGYIRASSDGSGVYTFWPLGEDGSKVERALASEVKDISLDSSQLRNALSESMTNHKLDDIEVPHPTGQQADWAAKVCFVPRALWNAETLRNAVQKYRVNTNKGLLEAPRGFVFYPVATTEDDVQWLRAQSKEILDTALQSFGDNPPPVVVALPEQPQSNFLNLLLRDRVLESWKIDRNKISQVGEQAFAEARKHTEEAIVKGLTQLRESHDFLVPQPYRSVVDALRIVDQRRSIGKVLEQSYEQAYGRGAPSFFTQHKRESSNLKKAVMLANHYLLRNSMNGFDVAAGTSGPARDLRAKFLQPGAGSNWGIVGVDGRVREPQSSRVLEAWRVLEDAIPPDANEVPIKDALLQLLNAPYGYDYNTLSLLFCAWFGLNSHSLKLSNDRRRFIDIDEIIRELQKDNKSAPKDFIDALCYTKNVRITRRDEENWGADIDALIERERMKELFSPAEATAAIAELNEYSNGEHSDAGKQKRAKDAANRLQADVERANEYDAFVAKIAHDVANVSQMEAALRLLVEFDKAPHLGIVTCDDAVSLSDLKAQMIERLHGITQTFCDTESTLRSIDYYISKKEKLEEKRKQFQSMGQPALVALVENAMNALDERRSELTDASKDSEFVNQLKPLRRETRLFDLREGLRVIDGYTPHVVATQNLMDEVRPLVQSAIEDAENTVAQWETRLPQAITKNEIQRIRNEVQRRLERYDQTTEYDRLDVLQNRCSAIENVLDTLNEHRRARPSDTKELERISKKIQALRDDENLSDAQKNVADEVQSHVEERVRQNIEEAVLWLQNAEARNASDEDAVRLMVELDKGRDFLPDEQTPRLRALKKLVQKRIDDDELLRVEASFRKIKDKSKRLECLKLLQNIVDER